MPTYFVTLTGPIYAEDDDSLDQILNAVRSAGFLYDEEDIQEEDDEEE